VNKLNIAMVVRSFSTSGGLELYTHKLVEGLLERGHKVTVVCEENRSLLESDNLSFHYFSGPEKGTLKGKRLAHYFEAASRALKQAGSFDLTHSQHLPVRGADVVTFHNHSVHRLYKVGKRWENFVNKAKLQVLPSYRLRDEYDQVLVNGGKCLVFSAKVCRDDFYENYTISANKPSVVAYPGASLAEQQERHEKNIFEAVQDMKPPIHDEPIEFDGKQPFTFLFVGRGYRKKGLDVLLSACQLLRKQGKLFHLLVAGIRLRPLDKLRLKFMDLTGLVTYLGFRKDMDSVYKQGMAIVLPSRVEPFGMTALQGMAKGLTPIVSRVSGVSEIIESNINGLVLEDHLSAHELAAKMSLLMRDRKRCQQMGEATRSAAYELTWDKTVADTLKAYEIALKEKKTSAKAMEKGSLNDEVQSKSLN
jgi:UDP-glucose:(heptosyl)LPS alpha-1,3-glucosyltransferase